MHLGEFKTQPSSSSRIQEEEEEEEEGEEELACLGVGSFIVPVSTSHRISHHSLWLSNTGLSTPGRQNTLSTPSRTQQPVNTYRIYKHYQN
jgi:hypothetical protein